MTPSQTSSQQGELPMMDALIRWVEHMLANGDIPDAECRNATLEALSGVRAELASRPTEAPPVAWRSRHNGQLLPNTCGNPTEVHDDSHGWEPLYAHPSPSNTGMAPDEITAAIGGRDAWAVEGRCPHGNFRSTCLPCASPTVMGLTEAELAAEIYKIEQDQGDQYGLNHEAMARLLMPFLSSRRLSASTAGVGEAEGVRIVDLQRKFGLNYATASNILDYITSRLSRAPTKDQA